MLKIQNVSLTVDRTKNVLDNVHVIILNARTIVPATQDVMTDVHALMKDENSQKHFGIIFALYFKAFRLGCPRSGLRKRIRI